MTALLQELVSQRPGTSCETEMAGDWNSLGIFIKVPGDYGPREIHELGNELVRLMASGKERLAFTFGWSAGIYQDGQLLSSFDPRSQPELMCTTCGHTQETWLGDTCLACRSNTLE